MNNQIIPKKGLPGLLENWQSDMIAALSVSLVALPLGLGIALASGVPPMAGILSAIVGGIVTTFFRGSHVAINGPTAGLVTVILNALIVLNDGSGQTLNYVLAAVVIAGFLQVLFGFFRLGQYADVFHSSVIRGILAAIGIIIIAHQIHVALGTGYKSEEVIESLLSVFTHIDRINPFVAVIAIISLLLLVFHGRISYKLFHMLPAPMWVLFISIPFVYAFNFFEPHSLYLFGNQYYVGPELLLDIPDNLLDSIMFPNFSKIDTWPFWATVFSITVIASIESLASSKAIDKIDPYRRKTRLNKDLMAVGLSTMVSGFIGGLPVITVILRSTVNVHNYAKTKWSNFYHGIFLLVFIFLLAPVIQLVPLCALAALLVFTGFKLASPRVFRQIYDQGIEQPLFFVGTLVITLYTDLLIGIFGGLALALSVHFLLSRLTPSQFVKMLFNSGTELYMKKDDSFELKVRGIANFLSAIRIDKFLADIPKGGSAIVDLSDARLVDFSILENLYEFQRNYSAGGGKMSIIGLDKHISSSNHKLALKIMNSPQERVSKRQLSLEKMAQEFEWQFSHNPEENIDYFQTFYFFKSRPIEYKFNLISDPKSKIYWEIADVTFDEGAFISSEEYDTTLGLIRLPFKIPKFTIEKSDLLSKYIELPGHKDIDYVIYHEFSDKFIVKVEDESKMTAFLNGKLKEFIGSSDINHLESNGEAILIFNDSMRLARIREYSKIIHFIQELIAHIKPQEAITSKNIS
ncbi:MAG: solute carrier family 23 protein [Vicingaceae bacterium]